MSQVPYRLCYAARPLNGIKILTSFFKTREHIQRKEHGPYFESQRQAHCNFSNVSRKSIQCLVSIKKGPNIKVSDCSEYILIPVRDTLSNDTSSTASLRRKFLSNYQFVEK